VTPRFGGRSGEKIASPKVVKAQGTKGAAPSRERKGPLHQS